MQELLTFRDTHGHCNVPQKYPDNPALGAWVAQQRRRYKLLALASERCRIILNKHTCHMSSNLHASAIPT